MKGKKKDLALFIHALFHAGRWVSLSLSMQQTLVRQRLCINLKMSSATTDNIKDALDYHAISVRLTEYIEQSSFQLIEILAEALAEILQKEFRVAIERP